MQFEPGVLILAVRDFHFPALFRTISAAYSSNRGDTDMGDKSPKNTQKTNKQKADHKAAPKGAPAKK